MKLSLNSLLYLGAFCSVFLAKSCANDEKQGEEDSTDSLITSDYFLFVSDVHLDTDKDKPTGHGSDTGMELWKMTSAKLKSITAGANPPKLIVFTGDLPCHFPHSGPEHNANVRTVLNDLQDIAGSIPLFYAPGNNDPLDGDYYPFADGQCVTPITLSGVNPGYPAPNAELMYAEDSLYGYYAARPFAGLRIIGMNTVMFSTSHNTTYSNECERDSLDQNEACMRQLKWLKGQLAAARAVGEKVYLIMHIPPGRDAHKDHPMWKDNRWQDSLLAHVNYYDPVISGIFYGHTHMDELRRLEVPGSPGSYSEVALGCPGVSPIFGNNPGFRKVYYNTSYEPTDFTTHYTWTNPDSSWGVGGQDFGDSTYTFSEYYGSGNTIRETVSAMPLSAVLNHMMETYSAKSRNRTCGNRYIEEGIEVEW